MPWTRTKAVVGVGTVLAVVGVAACGAPAASTGSARTALGTGAAASAPTASSTVAPMAVPAAPAPTAAVVVKPKHSARIAPTLSALDPVSTIIATTTHRIAVYATPNGRLLRHFSA